MIYSYSISWFKIYMAREFVRYNFLITRHLREYLTLIRMLMHKTEERIILK